MEAGSCWTMAAKAAFLRKIPARVCLKNICVLHRDNRKEAGRRAGSKNNIMKYVPYQLDSEVVLTHFSKPIFKVNIT